MTNNTLSKDIATKLYSDAPDLLTKEEAMLYSMKLLTLMTRKQREGLRLKLKRCLYYIDAIKNKGMRVKRVRSIIKRQEGLSRQSMNEVCRPCDEIMHGNNLK